MTEVMPCYKTGVQSCYKTGVQFGFPASCEAVPFQSHYFLVGGSGFQSDCLSQAVERGFSKIHRCNFFEELQRSNCAPYKTATPLGAAVQLKPSTS
jgi:hypothetical protein